MTYNHHTRSAFCNTCGKSQYDRTLFVYHKTNKGKPYGSAMHLCQFCIDADAFFCITCQQIHAPGVSCGQLNFLNEPKEEKPDHIEQP